MEPLLDVDGYALDRSVPQPVQLPRHTVRAANQLDENVGVRLSCHLNGILIPFQSVQIRSSVFASVPSAYRDDLQRPPATRSQQGRLPVEQGQHARPYGAEAGDGDPN